MKLGGFTKEGLVTLGEGNSRAAAATKLYLKTGNDTYLNQIRTKGLWTPDFGNYGAKYNSFGYLKIIK